MDDGQMPLVLTSGPWCSVEYCGTTSGRPLVVEFLSMSILAAQLTVGSYFSATNNSPFVRSSGSGNPSTWNPKQRPGDNKCVAKAVAVEGRGKETSGRLEVAALGVGSPTIRSDDNLCPRS